jgi:acetyl-CoA carboxylase biotin carboxyl carrier protein
LRLKVEAPPGGDGKDGADSPTRVTTDPDKLREVLTNLLHNAVEYNRPQGSIDLRVARDNGLVRVESPMVGTFYRAPQPGAPPFVEEGDAVEPGQTLCILEAMKLMNEVKAEIEAVVRAIHPANAEAVEYGQLLFELEPINGRPLDAV